MSKDIKKDYTDEILKNNVIARFESHGERFEIIISPEAVERIRDGSPLNMEDLASEFIFSDAKKGNKASEDKMEEVFNTNSIEEIATKIILKGDIQLTTEQRHKMQKNKTNRIIETISKNAMDPKTKAPHPRQRIELAMEQAGVHVDPFKPVSEQVKLIIELLRPIIPISMENIKISIKIPAEHIGKAYGTVRNYGSLEREDWQSDGSWIGIIRIPAGMQNDFYDKINDVTKGNVSTKILK
ncbi:MAG: ribosome assembly factor SBDS [Thermoplasmatales archaeon]|nr:MAG: ribosome assembly factor SBDS [Thermoplasmatales archaeon]